MNAYVVQSHDTDKVVVSAPSAVEALDWARENGKPDAHTAYPADSFALMHYARLQKEER